MGGLNNPAPQIVPYQASLPGIYSGAFARIAGQYYGAYGGSASVATDAFIADRIYAIPFIVMIAEAFDRISVNVSTAGSAGSKARLGIYYNDVAKPGARLLDAGEIDVDSTGVKEITITQTLQPGLYWLVLIAQANISVYCPLVMAQLIGTGSVSVAASGNGAYITTQAYGALPDPHPTPVVCSGRLPGVCLRRA